MYSWKCKSEYSPSIPMPSGRFKVNPLVFTTCRPSIFYLSLTTLLIPKWSAAQQRNLQLVSAMHHQDMSIHPRPPIHVQCLKWLWWSFPQLASLCHEISSDRSNQHPTLSAIHVHRQSCALYTGVEWNWDLICYLCLHKLGLKLSSASVKHRLDYAIRCWREAGRKGLTIFGSSKQVKSPWRLHIYVMQDIQFSPFGRSWCCFCLQWAVEYWQV